MVPPIADVPSLLPLFFLSFLSEILIPIPIGLILIAMLIAGFAAGPVIFISLLGFTLGAVTAYSTGRYGLNRWNWFQSRQDSKTYVRTKGYYNRFGAWTVLGVWVPAVGKYIPPVAGIMKLPWTKFLPLYVLGKTLYFIPLFLIFLLLSSKA